MKNLFETTFDKFLMGTKEKEDNSTYIKLAKDIENAIIKIFPKSYVHASFTNSFGKTITIETALGKNKTEWYGSIFNNDPAHNEIIIDIGEGQHVKKNSKEYGKYRMINGFGGTLTIPGERGVDDTIEIPFKTATFKFGDEKKLIANIIKQFKKRKDIIKQNVDKYDNLRQFKDKV